MARLCLLLFTGQATWLPATQGSWRRRPPEPDITVRPHATVLFLIRFFDEPMELRSSSFSSWDDSSDFYWKKKSTKEADTILKTTGYSDRCAEQSSGVKNRGLQGRLWEVNAFVLLLQEHSWHPVFWPYLSQNRVGMELGSNWPV